MGTSRPASPCWIAANPSRNIRAVRTRTGRLSIPSSFSSSAAYVQETHGRMFHCLRTMAVVHDLIGCLAQKPSLSACDHSKLFWHDFLTAHRTCGALCMPASLHLASAAMLTTMSQPYWCINAGAAPPPNDGSAGREAHEFWVPCDHMDGRRGNNAPVGEERQHQALQHLHDPQQQRPWHVNGR